VVAAALALSILLLAVSATLRMALLLAIGAALGIALQHASFGFASAYRRFQLRCETAALHGQLLMLAVATVLFAPVLAEGAFFSGVASLSFHDWLWIACALAGSVIGVRCRPRFGLSN